MIHIILFIYRPFIKQTFREICLIPRIFVTPIPFLVFGLTFSLLHIAIKNREKLCRNFSENFELILYFLRTIEKKHMRHLFFF